MSFFASHILEGVAVIKDLYLLPLSHTPEARAQLKAKAHSFLAAFDAYTPAERLALNAEIWMRLYLQGESRRSPSPESTRLVARGGNPRLPDYTFALYDVVSLVERGQVSMEEIGKAHAFIQKTLHRQPFVTKNLLLYVLYAYHSKTQCRDSGFLGPGGPAQPHEGFYGYRPRPCARRLRDGPRTQKCHLFHNSQKVCLRYAFTGSCGFSSEIPGAPCPFGYMHVCLACYFLLPPEKRCSYVTGHRKEMERVGREKMNRYLELVRRSEPGRLLTDPPETPEERTARREAMTNMGLHPDTNPQFLVDHDLLIRLDNWLKGWELDPENRCYAFYGDAKSAQTYPLQSNRVFALREAKVLRGYVTPFTDDGLQVELSRVVFGLPSTPARLRCPLDHHLSIFGAEVRRRPLKNLAKGELRERRYFASPSNATAPPSLKVKPLVVPDAMAALELLVTHVISTSEYRDYISERGPLHLRLRSYLFERPAPRCPAPPEFSYFSAALPSPPAPTPSTPSDSPSASAPPSAPSTLSTCPPASPDPPSAPPVAPSPSSGIPIRGTPGPSAGVVSTVWRSGMASGKVDLGSQEDFPPLGLGMRKTRR